MEESEQEVTTAYKLKAFAVVEVVCAMISLVMPITPSKTGKPFKWPETWNDYFGEVLFSFLLANAVIIVIFVCGWVYLQVLKKRPVS